MTVLPVASQGHVNTDPNSHTGDEPDSTLLNEDVQLHWLSGEYYNMAFGLQNIEMRKVVIIEEMAHQSEDSRGEA